MKKILASMLSIALLASSFVVSFAEDKIPYADATITKLDKTTFESVLADYDSKYSLADDETAYEVSVALKDLPELKRGGASGTDGGVRVGSTNIKLAFDTTDTDSLNNISYVIAMDSAFKSELSGDDYGYDVSAYKFSPMTFKPSKSELDNAIAILFSPMEGKECFPRTPAQENLVVDGTLKDAYIVYVVVKGSANIKTINSEVSIVLNGDMQTKENTTVYPNSKAVDILIGEKATEPVDPPVECAPEYFSANLTYAKTAMDNNGMIQFTFEETTKDSTVTKYADYDFGKAFPDLESGTNLTLNIKVDGVPSTVDSLVLKGATWGIQAKNPAN